MTRAAASAGSADMVGAKFAARAEDLADAAKALLLADPVAKEGYEAGAAHVEAFNASRGLACPPACPHDAGSAEAARWELGFEQAALEGGSPDSWRDGGGGREGALRLVGEVAVLPAAPDMVAAGREAAEHLREEREQEAKEVAAMVATMRASGKGS